MSYRGPRIKRGGAAERHEHCWQAHLLSVMRFPLPKPSWEQDGGGQNPQKKESFASCIGLSDDQHFTETRRPDSGTPFAPKRDHGNARS